MFYSYDVGVAYAMYMWHKGMFEVILVCVYWMWSVCIYVICMVYAVYVLFVHMDCV